MGDAGAPVDYDRTERQSTGIDITVSADADSRHFKEDVFVFDPAGGLDRGELAELVGGKYLVTVETGNSNQSGGVVMYDLMLSTSADSGLSTAAGAPGVNHLYQDEIVQFEDEVGPPATTAQAEILHDEDDDDRIFWYNDICQGTIEDDTNGVGAGPDYHKHTEMIDYRLGGGSGPVFDRHTELHWHYGCTQQGGEDVSFEIAAMAWLIWHVFEE